MKKKLEAELISIAHRILKLKNKSELDQLYLETQKLYEKLSVLKFVEENFADVKPTIGKAAAESIVETAFEKEESPQEEQAEQNRTEPVAQENQTRTEEAPAEITAGETPGDKDEEEAQVEETEIQEPEQPEEEKLEAALETPIEKEVDQVIAEAEEAAAVDLADGEQEETEAEPIPEESEAPQAQKETDIPAEENVEQPTASTDEDLFKPAFEWTFDAKTDESKEESPNDRQEEPAASGQIAFEDLLGAGYVDPVFVKPEETSKPAVESYEAPTQDTAPDAKPGVIPISRREDKVPVFRMNNESAVSLNDRLSKGITVGLNDRIAFVKNLFNNSNEDYNRVLSQLITFDTFAEAQDFIDNMVKPDYNNWEGKDEFAQRFMEVVEKKFS